MFTVCATKNRPLMSTQDITSWNAMIIEDQKEINRIVDILDALQATDDIDTIVSGSQSTYKMFRHLLDTETGLMKKAGQPKKKKPKTEKGEAKQAISDWVQQQFNAFVSWLTGLLSSSDADTCVVSFQIILRCIKMESHTTPGFNNTRYLNALKSLLKRDSENEENDQIVEMVLDALTESFINRFSDLLWYTIRNAGNLTTDMETHDQIDHLHYLFQHLELPNSDRQLQSMESYLEWSERPLVSNNKGKKKKNKNNNNNNKKRGHDDDGDDDEHAIPSHPVESLNDMRKQFTTSWLAFLKTKHMPVHLYKRVLVDLHKDILPHMTTPLLLMDFLTASYDIGGVTSVLALNGLFVLITKYNLDYPEFFAKLYCSVGYRSCNMQ
eukprot:TRINITY_DN976_c1_g1_i5.p1 TRINITY_DN976_c1_g1~~TRINITY_DN976_c1_g1_i5.p1  ORF type:complete len:382 (-),score=118.04 TRINITY_DN976_c1_g1_i5:115-1260(-)